MPRGRGRGRGGRGRGRGRGRATGVSTTTTATHGAENSDDAALLLHLRPATEGSGSAAALLTSSADAPSAKRGRGGRGGRGRGSRGGRAVSHETRDTAHGAQAAVHVVSASSSATADGFVPQQQPQQSPPVVVVVPQGRMITRSLLRGTSSLQIDDVVESQTRRSSSSSTAGAGGRRKRTAGTAATSDADTPLSPLFTDQPLSGSLSASSMTLGSLTDSPAIAPIAAVSPSAMTAALNGGSVVDSSPLRRVVIGGLLRCVCNAFLVSPSETLLECSRCRNWCHPACVGVAVEDLRLYQRHRTYICPFCAPHVQATETLGEVAQRGAEQRTNDSDTFPMEPLLQQQQQRPAQSLSITTILGESIPVVCSPSSPGPPLLSNTFTGASASTHGSDDGPQSPQTPSTGGCAMAAAAAASPVIAGVATASPASSAFPLASRQPPVPRQLPQKLRDVPDVRPPPAIAEHLESLLRALESTAAELGYTALHLPAHQLTDAQMRESLACCTDAIREATFSADYPAYCLKEVQQRRHPYMQGTALQSTHDGVICAFVLSNGRDFYGNMRSTITQMKSALHRGFLHPEDVSDFMAHCMTISDVSDFVHITLSATHASYQRRGLARLLMAMELLKWALRGRTRAFLNMAIEKHLVDGGTRIEFASPAASRHLYASFGFADVFPRYDAVTKKERWTAKEADMGRVMANVSFVDDVQRVAAELPAKYRSAALHDQSGGGGSSRDAKDNRVKASLQTVGLVAGTPPGKPASAQDRSRNGGDDGLSLDNTSTSSSAAATGATSARASRRSLFSTSPDVIVHVAAVAEVARDARKRHRSGSPVKSASTEGAEAEPRGSGRSPSHSSNGSGTPRRRLSISH